MVEFAGILFRGLTLDDVFSEHEGLKHITTVNAAYIVAVNENHRIRRIVSESVATFDGQIPFVLAQLLNHKRCFRKISGSELIFRICERGKQRGERVFLLGGLQESNAQSQNILRIQHPGLAIDGYSPPFAAYPFPEEHNASILQKIKHFRPHYLLVGFGAIKQLYWIDDNVEALNGIGVRYVIGVGGAFEMVSGKLKRAPRFVQLMGLEGVYRFVQQPERFRLQRLILSLRFLRYV